MIFKAAVSNCFQTCILCRELPYTVDEAETLPLASVFPTRWKKRGRKVGDVKI